MTNSNGQVSQRSVDAASDLVGTIHKETAVTGIARPGGSPYYHQARDGSWYTVRGSDQYSPSPSASKLAGAKTSRSSKRGVA